jgi:hypothetical protein
MTKNTSGTMPNATTDGAALTQATRALLQASETLARVLDAENRALKANDDEARTLLLDAKTEASHVYEQMVRAFADARAVVPSLDGAMTARLKRAGDRLAAASDENERRLRVAVLAQRRLLETIAQAVRKLNSGPGTYGRNGGPARPRRSCAQAPSLSLDRAL